MIRQRHHRPAMIFVTALWVVLILSIMALLFARSMRIEVQASGFDVSDAQASAVEQGAEQWVLSQVDNTTGDAVQITQNEQTVPEGIQIGQGYFFIITPDPVNPQNYLYGITDEASKLNLNTATESQLLALPNMNYDAADSIIDWVDTNSNTTNQGAENDYYNSLARPYNAKNSLLETPEELLLIKGDGVNGTIDETLLWNMDVNRNGVLEPNEGSPQADSNGLDTSRGIFPFITVFTVETNLDSSGMSRVNINTALASQGGANGGGGAGGRGRGARGGRGATRGPGGQGGRAGNGEGRGGGGRGGEPGGGPGAGPGGRGGGGGGGRGGGGAARDVSAQAVTEQLAPGGGGGGGGGARGGGGTGGGPGGAAPGGGGGPGGATTPGGGTAGGSSASTSQSLLQVLETSMSSSRAQQIMTSAGQGPFTSVFDFANKTKMTASELSPILDRLTTVTTSTSSGLVNVNTASATVLTAIGFDPGDAQTIVAARQGAETNVEGGSGMSWLLNALPMSKLAPVGAHLTGRSYFYSADIVAVSGDGRAFKRVRIVVNARNTPAKIVYRKDMTEYGWPLDPQIRYSLRTGQGLPAGIGSSSSSLGTTR